MTDQQFTSLARNFFTSYANTLNRADLERAETLVRRALASGAGVKGIKLLYVDAAQKIHDIHSPSQGDARYIAAKELLMLVDKIQSAKKPSLQTIVEENLPPFVSIEQPDVVFGDVIGQNHAKKEIRRVVVDPFTNAESWQKYFSSDEAKEGIILTGPPGCGKTLLMRAAAGEGNATFIYLKGEEVPQGKEAESVGYVFNLAKKYQPSIIFIDECHAVLNPRRTRFVTPMQKELDGFSKLRAHILVAGNTNKPWEIDTTLRRAGRFGTVIFVPPPVLEERQLLFGQKLARKPLHSDIDYRKLGEITDGYSPADIAEVCKRASISAYNEERDIVMRDLEAAIKGRRPSTIEWYAIAKDEIEKSDARKEVFGDLLSEVNKYIAERGIAIK